MGCEVVSMQVLLATYNGETYLPQQLESLRTQTATDFTVLMQDDGSTDGTLPLLKSWTKRDPRFQLSTDCGQHYGAKGNFLSLIRQSTADYVALCDQDDEWMPVRLQRCREALQAAEAQYGASVSLLVHSDARLVSSDEQLLQESFFRHQGWDPTAVTLPRLLVQNNVTGGTLMMNAALCRLVAKHGDAQTMHMHDWFIALTAAAFGHVLFIDEPLENYRQHGINVMGASRKTLIQRGIKALSAWEKGKKRIALTYTHTRAFRNAYGDTLPDEARSIIDRYLATEKQGKLQRVLAVQRGGYTMQSTVTRLGQILFG